MPFLYGKTDEKFKKVDSDMKNRKLKPLDTYSYKFPMSIKLNENQKIKPYEVSIRLKTSPDKLVEICSPVLDIICLPHPFYWNVLEVVDWILKLGFPQYQVNTFKKNHINGRCLVRLDASYLVKMNIKDFNHLKTITQAIRKLFGYEKSVFNRSISMPNRELGSLYRFYHTRTGPKYDTKRRTDVGRMYHLIRPGSVYKTHWQSLELWFKHTDPHEREHIGATMPRINTMYSTRKGEYSICQKTAYRDCSGIPPCMCNWTQETDLRNPWQLKCLEMRNKIHNKIKTHTKCRCSKICPRDESRKGLTFLKEYIPHKYGTKFI